MDNLQKLQVGLIIIAIVLLMDDHPKRDFINQ